MNGLKKANIEIDRKMLADIAVMDKPAFAQARRPGQGQPRGLTATPAAMKSEGIRPSLFVSARIFIR